MGEDDAELSVGEDNQEIPQSDCCGNGCRNCILDQRAPIASSSRAKLLGKKNVLLNYAKFKLLSIQLHNDEDRSVVLLHFGAADVDAKEFMLEVPPGHHVMMRCPAEQNCSRDAYLLRPYSPYWTDVLRMEFKLLVCLYEQGRMSRIIRALRPADTVEFRGPMGNYSHIAGSPRSPIILIVQGVAIAPTLPIVEQVLNNGDDLCRLYHLVCAKDFEHIYFRERLLEYNRYWNYKSSIYLSRVACTEKNCCVSGLGCTAQCKAFCKKLRHSEHIVPQRLDATELVRVCTNLLKDRRQGRFIIAGSNAFQDYFAEVVWRNQLAEGNENVVLL